MDGLVEKVARAIAADLGEQDFGGPFLLGDNLRIDYIDQGETDLGQTARAAIEAVFVEVARHLSAVQYDPAPYNALLKRLAALRKQALG